MNEIDLDELRSELDEFAQPLRIGGKSATEQRIIAGFEEIERCFEERSRAPEHGETHDIFERLYAVRLDRMRESAECREVLKDIDKHGLLHAGDKDSKDAAERSDDELFSTLAAAASVQNGITQLVHVRSREQIKAAEEIARRTPCKDFAEFKPVFETVQRELQAGERRTVAYGGYTDIKKGNPLSSKVRRYWLPK